MKPKPHKRIHTHASVTRIPSVANRKSVTTICEPHSPHNDLTQNLYHYLVDMYVVASHHIESVAMVLPSGVSVAYWF